MWNVSVVPSGSSRSGRCACDAEQRGLVFVGVAAGLSAAANAAPVGAEISEGSSGRRASTIRRPRGIANAAHAGTVGAEIVRGG